MAATLDVIIEGSRLRAVVVGEVDMSNSEEIHQEIEEAFSNDIEDLVIDLSAVRYFDSSGLRMLFNLAEQATLADAACRVVVAEDSSVLSVINAVQLADVAAIEQRKQASD